MKMQKFDNVWDALADTPEEPTRVSIMGLHSLDAEIWRGVDAQAYVNELRNEWDRPA